MNKPPLVDGFTARLAALLREAAEAHHGAEKRLPAHDWQDWYASYLAGRLNRETVEDAEAMADIHIHEVTHA